VLDQCRGFLAANPSEYILMRLKEEHTSADNTRSYDATVRSFIEKQPKIWYTGIQIPLVGEVRGKIVLLSNWSNATMGIPFDHPSLSIQDEYKITGPIDYGWKWNHVRAKLDEAKCDPGNVRLYLSHASAWTLDIADVARYMNPRVRDYFQAGSPDWACTVPMDFPDDDVIRAIFTQAVRRFQVT
jgi:1-phosphatidylinositol phosphodiesterase